MTDRPTDGPECVEAFEGARTRLKKEEKKKKRTEKKKQIENGSL